MRRFQKFFYIVSVTISVIFDDDLEECRRRFVGLNLHLKRQTDKCKVFTLKDDKKDQKNANRLINKLSYFDI